MARRRRFSEDIKGGKKVKNHPQALAAKIALRVNVIEAIGPDRAVVFDAFAGSGEMFRGVWRRASAYVGCDSDADWRDERCLFVADNRRVLRSLDLAPFTVFDFDAFGSPWEQAIIVAARRRVKSAEQIGIVLTEGSGLNLKQGGLPNTIRELTGLRARMPGLARWQDDIVDRCVAALAARFRCRVVKRWQAVRRQGSSMFYIGLVLEGLPDG